MTCRHNHCERLNSLGFLKLFSKFVQSYTFLSNSEVQEILKQWVNLAMPVSCNGKAGFSRNDNPSAGGVSPHPLPKFPLFYNVTSSWSVVLSFVIRMLDNFSGSEVFDHHYPERVA